MHPFQRSSAAHGVLASLVLADRHIFPGFGKLPEDPRGAEGNRDSRYKPEFRVICQTGLAARALPLDSAADRPIESSSDGPIPATNRKSYFQLDSLRDEWLRSLVQGCR